MDIEQGNVISQDEIAQLHSGMSEAQVKAVMGSPILVNIFTPNRLEYVYSYRPAYDERIEKRVSLTFSQGRLAHIESR